MHQLRSQAVDLQEMRGRLSQVKLEFEHAKEAHEQKLTEKDE